jgi:hypothetical protein
MVYSECASSCPKTCQNYYLNFENDECKQGCSPGCVCQEGYYRNAALNNTCTPQTDCLCIYKDKAYQTNDTVNVECNTWFKNFNVIKSLNWTFKKKFY